MKTITKITFALLAIMLVFTACSKDDEKTTEADINGKWGVTEVGGGPVTIYPGGRNNPGIPLDFNLTWKGAIFEFTNGICFLTIPNTPQDQIGGYTVKGKRIIFDNNNDEKQEATYQLNGSTMKLTFSAASFKKLIAEKSNGGVDMDIASDLVFNLKKQ